MKKNSIPKLELVFLLLLTGMCPQAHATDDGRNASPQKTYAVDLTLGSATVLTFTEAVTSQTGVLFSYESALSQMPLGDVSVHETAAPLEHILEKVFKGRGFRYKVVDRIVVLTYDTDSARSQLVLVTGRVKDGSGMPLVGASVVVKDTMRGVSAGAEGNYRIFADPEATLVFSYIGYADREERIGTRSAIDVVLEEYEAVLEDVVVVGYGTQSRRTVTAAISKFDGHLLEGIPVNSVGDALKGRIPGVRVATTDATPGSDPWAAYPPKAPAQSTMTRHSPLWNNFFIVSIRLIGYFPLPRAKHVRSRAVQAGSGEIRSDTADRTLQVIRRPIKNRVVLV